MGVLGLIQRICGWLAARPLCRRLVHKTAEEHQILRFFHSGSFSASSSSSESSANMGTGCVLTEKKREKKRNDLTTLICGEGTQHVLAPQTCCSMSTRRAEKAAGSFGRSGGEKFNVTLWGRWPQRHMLAIHHKCIWNHPCWSGWEISSRLILNPKLPVAVVIPQSVQLYPKADMQVTNLRFHRRKI